ncbi:unnamed protein product, partial [Closterium sp. NIES-54]
NGFPSIAMVETFARLLLVAPHTLNQTQTIHPPHTFVQTNTRQHILQASLEKYVPGESNNSVPLLLLELINYRLIPFFRCATHNITTLLHWTVM